VCSSDLIVTVKGQAMRLTQLSDSLTTIKGIKHGKLVMSRAD
jgi:CopG family nickel-responsive transcriptional regulator